MASLFTNTRVTVTRRDPADVIGQRCLLVFTQGSSLNFGDWGDGSDFHPLVKQACESYKNASKST